MRWKRSAREKILGGISFNKRGEESVGTSEGKSSRLGPVIKIFFLFILVIGLIALAGYLSSSGGQRAFAAGVAFAKTWTLEKPADFINSIFSFGKGDYFSSTVNRSSSKQGADLKDFTSIAGPQVPAGATIDFQYEFEFNAMKSSDTIDAEFSCSLNSTKEDEAVNLFGQIVPDIETTISKGSTVLCRFSGEQTADLSGEYIAYGGYQFDYETKDATLPVYFISDTVNQQVQARDQSFFDAYDLPVSSSDLRVLYNGEPIGIAMGVGAGGVEGQPVVVSTGETPVYNTIGITLENKWNGDIAELKDLILYLPEGVTLDEGKNGAASLGCPFASAGTDSKTRDNMYILDTSVKDKLFDFYIKNHAFFGKEDRHTFQCWVAIDQDFVGDAPYVTDEYRADASYVYKVKDASEAITIVGGEQ